MPVSPYRGDTLSSSEWYGEVVECELCERVRQCTERCELLTCRQCQADFLPRRRLL